MNESTPESRYRAEIACENELIAKRLHWNLTFQGLLFASYGIIISSEKDVDADILRSICILGFIAALSSLASTLAALARISELKADWQTSQELIKLDPAPFSHFLMHYLGHNSSVVIPVTTGIWWAAAMYQ